MHEDFLDDIAQGRLEDHRIERYLNERVLDVAQRAFLATRQLTVADVLNGRYLLSDRNVILTWMHSVNERIGGKVFFPEYC